MSSRISASVCSAVTWQMTSYHPETGEVLVSRDKMMDENDAKKIIDAGYHRGQDPYHR